MTKICLISDTHYGARGDNPALYNYFNKFMKEEFFPVIDHYGIKHIIHLGDLFDRRKQVTYKTAHELRENFIQPIIDRDIQCDVLVGNHDVPYKNTNYINSIDQLYGYSDNIHVFEKPTDFKDNRKNFLYLPWINKENIKDTLELIENTNADYVFGHLELTGFQMHKGSVCTHGMDGNVFSKFEKVFSGHFHHKSTAGNIHYLGAPYEMIWSDYDDPRGFHILDTDTGELEYFRNPNPLFQVINFDNSFTKKHIDKHEFSVLTEKYVRVNVTEQIKDVIIFDYFIEKITENNPIDLKIVDDSVMFTVDGEALEEITEGDDTRQVIISCVDAIETEIDKEVLKARILELYDTAMKTT